MEARPRQPAGRRGLRALIGAALLGALPPALLLLPSSLAHGYDGWYYVLQVRALLDGVWLFADRSLVFGLLAGLGALTGDVILGNKLAACLFGAVTAAGGLVAGRRWTGSVAGGVACGAWWALSPLRLGVSAEYLKNSAGVAVLALLIAALAGEGRRSMIAAVSLGVLGLLVHKLTGVLGLLLLAVALAHRLSGRLSPRVLAVAIGLGGVVALGVGLLRMEDLARLTGGEAGAPRLMLLRTGRLIGAEKLELVVVHLTPILLAVGLVRRPAQRALGLGLLGMSVVVLAPGLPLGWDQTAWRLLLMGALPAGAVAALAASRWPPLAAGVLLAGLAVLPGAVSAQRARSPDYAALSAMLPIVQAHIPAGQRVVAHRGLCGFLWAEGGIVCENFQPQGALEGWWRVVFGFSAARLSRAGAEAVPLVPSYALVREEDWQRFVQGEGSRFSLTHDPRNPYRARPDFVYGPGETTPQSAAPPSPQR